MEQSKMEQPKETSKKGKFPTAFVTTILILTAMLSAVFFAGYRQFIYTEALKKSHELELKVVKEATAALAESSIKLAAEVKLRKSLIRVIMDFQPKLDKHMAKEIVHNILEESHQKNIDPILIAALIWVESRFDPFAKSNKDAIGLMQIRYKVWKKEPALLDNGARKEGSLYWIDINIKSGISIFNEYYEYAEFDVIKTLYRYNTGSTKLPKGKRYHEISYVNKVLISAYKIRSAITE